MELLKQTEVTVEM